VAIGAIGNGSNSGHVRVYKWNGTSWVQRGLDIDGETIVDGDNEYSVSLSADGTIVAIGVPNNEGNGTYPGHTRIFVYTVVPDVPTNLSVTPGNAKLSFKWKAPVFNGNSPILHYVLKNGSSTENITPSGPDGQGFYSYEKTSLTNGTSYTFEIAAENSIGPSEYVSFDSAMPVAPNNGGVPCIVEGQRILTQRGYVKVEELTTTDSIITSDNRQVAANVYKFTIEKTTDKTAPITIKANAFAPRSPPNDVRLSPLHAIQRTKGVWDIPIKATKRYENVIQDEPGQSVTYYHIETPNYLKDNLVVEGAVVESFGNNYAKKHNLTPTDIYSWSSTLKGYTRISPSITKNKTK
jgi:hypothetical protein